MFLKEQIIGKGDDANQKLPDTYISESGAQKLIGEYLTTGWVLDVKKTKISRDKNDTAL